MKNYNIDIIRWKGDHRVYSKIFHFIKIIKKNKSKIIYNVTKAIKHIFKFCFKSSDSKMHKEYSDDIFIDLLSKDDTFCSHLIFFLLKFSIGSVASENDGFVKDSDDINQPFTKALNITPSNCYPSNILELPKKYPKFWEVIKKGGKTKKKKKWYRQKTLRQ
jgi:hypothetical protein